MFRLHIKKITVQLMLLITLGFGVSEYLVAESLLQFHTLNKKDGLASSVVNDIAQDKRGFIWFATDDGLQRYDGIELFTYRHNRLDENSLTNNIVRTLFVDNSGQLWVGTENGLDLYQSEFDNFVHFRATGKSANELNSNRIRTIYQSPDFTVWVGTTEGLSLIDPVTHLVKSYPHQKIRTIFEDDYQQLWIGTLGNGLFLFNRTSEQFVPINSVQADVSRNDSDFDISSLNIIDIQQDSFGHIYIATWGEGVFLLKRDSRVLIKQPFNLPSPFVRSIHLDKDGQFWFGTKKGILVVETSLKSGRTILADERNHKSLLVDNITAIFQGDDDTIWIGTYGGGVSRYFPESKRFETFGIHPIENEGLIDPVVYALHENPEGNIWVGSETGKIALFDTYQNKFKHFDLSYKEQENKAEIRAIYQNSSDSILIGTTEGLLNYNFNKLEMSEFNSPEQDFLAGMHDVTFISADASKRIWIGIEGKGITVFDTQKNGKLTEVLNERILLKSPRKIVHGFGNSSVIAVDGENLKKVTLLKNQKGKMRFVTEDIANTANLSISGMDVDWKNRLWFGTSSGGVKVLAENGEIISIDEANGLPNNRVYSVVADPISQQIWISTNMGITAINPENLEMVSFTAADGLQGNEFNAPGIRSASGFLYFGGINGFNRFYPKANKKSLTVKPPVLLTMTIANEEIKFSESGVLKNSLMTTNSLELKHEQMPFSFRFTSPQFIEPEKVNFRYRLKGLSDKWITSTGFSRSSTYTNIGSGNYQFELQVADKFLNWTGKQRVLDIQVNPPWWATKLAYFIYSMSFLALMLITSYLVYQRRLKEKNVQYAIKENEERLKLSLWGSGYEFWDWNLESGEISRSNEFKNIQIECNRISKNLYQLATYIHPSDLSMVRNKLSEHIAGQSKHFDLCYRIVDAQNGWRWIQDRGKVVAMDENGNALRISGTQRDVTDIKVRDEQFDMLGQAFKSTSDGVWIRDKDWRLVECNPAYEKITGFSLAEKKGEILWFPEIQEQSQNLNRRIRDNINEKGSWQGEVWAERKNHDAFPQKLSIDTLHDEKGNIKYYVGVFSDITFHKRTEEEFRKLANYDSLTGLPNRACLYDRLSQTIEKTKRDNGRIALFLIDIDNFKRINDSLGHNVGDILIRQVASRLVNCNKEGDTVARIGGDEFVIVLENVKSSTAIATYSESLLKELNQPILVKGQQLKLNFSVGITLAPDDAINAERLMRNADTAMYEAKKKVENSYRFYSIEFNERAKKRLELENALRKAIDNDTIELFYQPKIDLNSGRVDGVEALARWTDKDLGFISPAEFIPLAEETGLIIPLGKNLLHQAAAQTKKWVDEGIMRGRTSVNLSAHQFWNRNLASEISNILNDVGLNSKYLELEITESACMQDMEETKAQIKILKGLGITLALDDFGTGYSSLAQLKALPFDTLKVDKSFVDNIESNNQDAKVVKAIIDIAKTMEMKVVIEGVESKSQCEYLWRNRAYIVQGFYFSRPVHASAVTDLFIKRWNRKEYLGKISSNVMPLG